MAHAMHPVPEDSGGALRWERAPGLDAALRRRAEGGWTPLAGGTDFYPARAGRAISERLLDLGGIAGLDAVELREDGGLPAWRIGALVTWTQLAGAVPEPALEALRLAAASVGSVQVRNQATVGGNLCHASAAADGIPPLLALDAQVELASLRGVRRLPLSAFVLGNRRTALGADELLTAVVVPRPVPRARSVFLKLAWRRDLVIAVASAAAVLAFDDEDRVAHCAIGVGACSPTAVRLSALEQALAGTQRAALARRLREIDPGLAFGALAPIDDVRASAAYRREAAAELVRRALGELAGAEVGKRR